MAMVGQMNARIWPAIVTLTSKQVWIGVTLLESELKCEFSTYFAHCHVEIHPFLSQLHRAGRAFL